MKGISFHEIWTSLPQGDSKFSYIVLQYRLPRVIVGILSGFGLAVLQSLIRNPLASPDVIGITKGAGFSATPVIFLFPGAPSYALPLFAFLGALFTFLLLLFFSKKFTLNPIAFSLIGIALGAIFQTGIQYIIVKHPTDINMGLLWIAGSL
ncbi:MULTISPECIES: iron chelate uptake ABC transporter family permease subunit [Bacillus cereus group]|uniref:iron chelate uptake ABC transporter family permease subunit n=1 Tax=Bacillus cereus group TaxID=86661 RepID=UPI001CD955C2|nr:MULTISPECIES: iron chelate uptake ABC transporter family permease subunit [Bacillus cereus group]